jgi:PST family polysaccharide transporter
VASFIVGLPWGAVGVAIAYAVSDYVVRLPATWWSTGRRGPIRTRDLVVTALPHAVATVATAVVLVAIAIATPSPSALVCLGLALLGYTVYGLVMLAFPPKRLVLGKNLRAFAGLLSPSGHAWRAGR